MQFAMTVAFHFIFPSISIGLAWMLILMETKALRTGDDGYAKMAKLFGKIFAITFAVGVATGITMEFQFGTNWSRYARFVGDIFGAPLAIEAIFSFFLESTFLGLYLFGGSRISPRLRWFSALMVGCGALLSAFWILVANSWQQTPAGYLFNPETNRAELSSFAQAVFNPSMLIRFFHTVDAAIICGAFIVAGVSAYHLLKNNGDMVARKALRMALIIALIASALELFPFGHEHARQVGKHQPEKLAAFEGLMEGGPYAPITLFGIPTNDKIIGAVRFPWALSMLVGFKPSTVVHGLNEFLPEDRPPVFIPFIGFHVMVGLGTLFIALSAYGAFQLWRGKLFEDKWLLRGFVAAIPLPVIACQAGWAVTEVGRQPWIVYHMLRTKDAVSVSVPASSIAISLVMFLVLYALLFALYLFLVCRTAKQGFGSDQEREVAE
jgi:cytochrome d ubiquinol oxidase subunit I